VHQLFRLLRRTSGNSAPQPQDYVHKRHRPTEKGAGSPPGSRCPALRSRRGPPKRPRASGRLGSRGRELPRRDRRGGPTRTMRIPRAYRLNINRRTS
jgi:hypothetical protein